MKELFKDKIKNDELKNLGFTTINYLDNSQVKELEAFYLKNTKTFFSGFHPTMFHDNLEYRKQVNNKILEIISPILDTYFNQDFEFLYANYMVKESGENSEMKIHQDWTYVDEKNDDSFAIWIPLINLNKTNGALTMIPKSHKFKLNERGPGLFCPFEPYFEMLKDNFSTPLYLKTGEAVIWNHRLAHYSPPNTSQTARIAITAIITPKNKEIIHYYKDNDSTRLTCYKVDADFFLKYKIGESPKENIFFKEDYSPKILDKNKIICTLT